jgi:hypothetical protein
LAIFFEPWPQNKIKCKFSQWDLWNFFPPKLPYYEEKQSEYAINMKNNKFVGIKIPKFQEVRK